MESPTFLTVAQVAKLLQVSPDTIYRELKTGSFPGAIRIGRTWRIHQEVLLRSLSKGDGRREESTP